MTEAEERTAQEVGGNGGAETAKKTVREGFEQAKGQLKEQYEKVSEKAHEVWDKAADTSLHDLQKTMHMYVRRHPGQSVLMAAGAGLIVGLLMRGGRG